MKNWVTKRVHEEGWRLRDEGHHTVVEIPDPLALVRLTGFLKRGSKADLVFFRGQCRDYPGMQTSIMHEANFDLDRVALRERARSDLTSWLSRKSKQTRFAGPVGAAVLQHYGIRGPWIDLVDNLFIAIWFATHARIVDQETSQVRYIRSKEDFGYIYFISVEEGTTNPKHPHLRVGAQTQWVDLRAGHSFRTLRAHTQHGLLAQKLGFDINDVRRYDFADRLLAVARIPNSSAFHALATHPPQFIFPPRFADGTYRRLLDLEVNKKVMGLEEAMENAVPRELGRIDEYD